MFGFGMGRSGVVGGIGLTARIAALFRSGEQGVWYDPSDRATLFQDSAGTTPVTAVEQPVGLMLDKSQGLVLGPELWANQTPTIVDVSGNVGAYNTGTRTMSNSGAAGVGGYPRFRFNFGMTAGRTYSVSGTLSGNLTQVSGVRLAVSGSANDLVYNNFTGVFQGRVTASGQILEITTTLDGSETVTISNISVRELPGNHAYQSTSASRPVLSAVRSSFRTDSPNSRENTARWHGISCWPAIPYASSNTAGTAIPHTT